MLSRTADSLFWMSRYIERAESLARILDATMRLAAMPAAFAGETNEWQAALDTAGCSALFQNQARQVNEAEVKAFLAFDSDNPSSIANCLTLARVNGRGVCTALTSEMWETINSAYLELPRWQDALHDREQFNRFIDWVKGVSLAFDGSAYRTLLRNDIYWFTRVGIYVERADNTARLIDVKYHLLLPETEAVGGSLDYFQWAAILRSVSALTAYHHVYRESFKPWLIADLLTLNRTMPRSLRASYENLVRFLDELAREHGRQGQAQRMARTILTRLENTTIEKVFQVGLHEFIEAFIRDNNRLGQAIAEQYLV
jgi:uncharacterized alpha-E superfamily protein